MPAHYDDPKFFYERYWSGREYEHESEVAAIRKFVGNSHFKNAADIGGGFGRLTKLLGEFSSHTTLVEPSIKQRKIAEHILISKKSKFTIISGTTQDTHLPNSSQDLILIVRVMHHLPNPIPTFKELYKILKPGGTLILEFANSANFKAQLKSFLLGQPILPGPIERRSSANIRKNTIPFVNHHPNTLKKQLTRAGFVIKDTLSVSNFRFGFFKKYLPLKVLLTLESKVQDLGSKVSFGPSIFILATKPVA